MKLSVVNLFKFNKQAHVNFLFIITVFLIFVLSQVLSSVFKVVLIRSEFIEIAKGSSHSNDIFRNFMLLIILSPILEELCFRLALVFKKANISLGIVSILFFTILHENISNTVILDYKNLLVFLGLVPLYFLLNRIIPDGFINSLSKHKFKIYYFSIIIFAFLHFDFTIPIYFSPIILLPQIIVGVILTFVRLKFTIFHAIILHMLLNAPVMLSLL